MSANHAEASQASGVKSWLLIGIMVLLGIPAGALRLLDFTGGGAHLSAGAEVLVFGGGIIVAAFLISWAGEAAQKDISQTLALAFLALIAVLPEYSVDLYFAWQAGQDPSGDYVHFATANMTGANRLLLGLGWPVVAILFWFKRRRSLQLERGISLELLFLGIATLYALTIPFKGGIALWDSGILMGLFVLYIWLSGKTEHLEPELFGPAAALGTLRPFRRRAIVFTLFAYCGVVILASAEPFAEGLLELGKGLGVDEFVMVQWVAPLASETPEMLIATIFALRGQAAAAGSILISAMVNQWTLLIGSLPVVYSLSLGELTAQGIPLDHRQAEEVWLTAAQGVFGVVLLLRRSLGGLGGAVLLLMWGSQLAITAAAARWGYVGAYLGMAVMLLASDRTRRASARRLFPEVLDIWRRPKEKHEAERREKVR